MREALGGWRSNLVLATILLPAILYGMIALEERRLVLGEAEAKLAATSQVFEEQARNVFETHSLIARQVNEHIRAMSWQEVEDSRELHEYLAGIAKEFHQIESLWLIDGSGTIRASSAVFPAPRVTVTDRDYFISLREHDSGVFVGPLVRGKVLTQDIFNVAQRRTTGRVGFDGVIVVSAAPGYLMNFWAQTIKPVPGVALLVRRDGAALARLPRIAAAATPLDGGNPLMRAIAASPSGVFRAQPPGEGEEWIYAYRKVADYPLYVSLRIATATALAPWRAHLIYYGVIFGAMVLGLASLALLAAQRARNEARARSSAARLRGLLEAAPDPMIVARQDGTISFANPQALEVFGYSAAELIGRPVEDLIAAPLRARHVAHRADFTAAPHKREMGIGLQLFAACKDGRTFPVDVSLSPMEMDGERLTMALVRDVSARKQMEAELDAGRVQLVNSARLSALGTMAGGIAHEVNNPLMIIHASASDLAEQAEDGEVPREEVLESSQRVAQYADRISRIIKSMLHIARDGANDSFNHTEVGTIVTEVLDVCHQRFQDHHIDLTVHMSDPGATIACRDVQIAQVLVNLLQNALDAVEMRDSPRWVRLETETRDGRVVISVIDSGPGVPEAVRARIMDPFFTTKPVGKGTGLGLSISRRIAVAHEGSLDMTERDGHTCFSLSLPAVP